MAVNRDSGRRARRVPKAGPWGPSDLCGAWRAVRPDPFSTAPCPPSPAFFLLSAAHPVHLHRAGKSLVVHFLPQRGWFVSRCRLQCPRLPFLLCGVLGALRLRLLAAFVLPLTLGGCIPLLCDNAPVFREMRSSFRIHKAGSQQIRSVNMNSGIATPRQGRSYHLPISVAELQPKVAKRPSKIGQAADSAGRSAFAI